MKKLILVALLVVYASTPSFGEINAYMPNSLGQRIAMVSTNGINFSGVVEAKWSKHFSNLIPISINQKDNNYSVGIGLGFQLIKTKMIGFATYPILKHVFIPKNKDKNVAVSICVISWDCFNWLSMTLAGATSLRLDHEENQKKENLKTEAGAIGLIFKKEKWQWRIEYDPLNKKVGLALHHTF